MTLHLLRAAALLAWLAPLSAVSADEFQYASQSAYGTPIALVGGGDSCCNYGCCDNSCCDNSCCNSGCCNSCCNDLCCNSCGNDDCRGGLFDNTVGWAGWESYKGVADSNPLPPGIGAGFMNSSGAVAGFNSGLGFGDSAIRAQFGASYGLYDWLGRDTINPSASESQVFATAGVFKRSNVCCDDRIAWGVVYDHFIGSNYGLFADEVSLSQARGLVGYAINDCNEFGVWGAMQLQTDRITPGPAPGTPTNIRTANQMNGYWRHNWSFGGETMAYAGWFDQAATNAVSFGLMGLAPLNDRVSLYGNFAYVVPVRGAGNVGSNDVIWSVSVGLQISFGSKARACNISGRQGLPLIPVANNGTFLITR